MEIKRLAFVFLECINYCESQKLTSPLAQDIYVIVIFSFRFQVVLWNTTHLLLFLQIGIFRALYNLRQLCYKWKRVIGQIDLGFIVKLLVRSDCTWTFWTIIQHIFLVRKIMLIWWKIIHCLDVHFWCCFIDIMPMSNWIIFISLINMTL